MPLTSNCSFTNEQRSQFLLEAEKRPASELWDELEIASQSPSQRLRMPTWTPSGLPTSREARGGGVEGMGGLSGSSETMDWPGFQP